METAVATLAMLVLLGQQPPPPAWLKPTGHVTIQANVEPQQGPPAGRALLVIEVSPAPGIHVYAPGNKDYIPVSLAIDPSASITPGTPVFPPSEPFVFGELKETVQVYQKTFRIRQPLTVRNRDAATVSGRLRFQACTDKVCFPPESLPFKTTIPAR